MKIGFKFLRLLIIGATLVSCTELDSSPTVSESKTSPQVQITDNPDSISATTTRFPKTPGQNIPPTVKATAPSGENSSLPTGETDNISASKTKYRLEAVLDYDNHHLSINEKILYTNYSRDTLDELLLVVEPSRYPDVFRIQNISWSNDQPVDYEQDLGQMRVRLPQPLLPGDRVQLDLVYELALPSPDSSYYGRPVPFGYSIRQTNLVDWYPFIPPYLNGQGWLAHQAGAFGEHLAYETADFEVSIQLNRSYPNLVIAASAPAEIDGDIYRYKHRSGRSFAWSVSHTYEVWTKEVGDVTVFSYAFPIHAAAGEAALETTAETLKLYTDLFGSYPHQTLSVVEADFLDGMEYDGLYFLSNGFYNLYSGTQGEYLVAIAAHETAHQWFYGLVGNDQALEPWLDEALCTYSERIYYEHSSPEALDWWYQYRVNYYQPRGWVDGSIYNPEGYRAYRDAVYLNGALFLDDLRSLMGDEAFFEFLRDYVAQYSNTMITGYDFFGLVKNHSSADLSNLIQKFFVTDYGSR